MPLVISGSADLTDVTIRELMLVLMELAERGETESAVEVASEFSNRVEWYDDLSPWWEEKLVTALQEEK